MKKSLDEMSNEELWQLFPILLREHDEAWESAAREEMRALKNAVGPANIVRFNHIGSTSVKGLLAKPTIDFLLEIAPETDLERLTESICSCGYRYNKQPDNPPPHMMFLKGYTPEGFRGQAYHLHVRYPGDWNELYFRDYLRDHPDAATEYAELKRGLKERFEHDRDGYTNAKTEWIEQHTRLARDEYGDRYACGSGNQKPE
jgi:GrpB-like predicted nucleotidyltransferase (UPF0157 family)